MTNENQPLAPFDRLVGGEWHMADSYHVFRWGAANKSFHSQSFFVAEGTPVPVGDGVWFFHPGEGVIRGYGMADGMGIDLFEYTSRWEGDTLINDLVTYDADGDKGEYVEHWEFSDSDTYEWTLYARAGDGLQKAMGGTFTRKAS